MMTKFSIIIPVYNAEKFLDDALNSIMVQNYQNIEIICLDDASTDSSLDILKSWASRDSRIRIISYTTNQGPGNLRNAGIKIAQGDWLLFPDADDWFENGLFYKLDEIIQHHKINIIEFGMYVAKTKTNKKIANWLSYGNSGIKKCSDVDIMLSTSLWNKAYNRDFFIDNGLCCCENNRSGEEITAHICGFLMAGEFYWLDFIGYNWRINPNSMSRSRKRDADFLAGVWDVLNTLKSEMQRLNLYDEYTYNKYCATILGWHINEKFSFRRPYRQYYNKCRELFAKTDQRQLKPYWRFALKRIF